VVTGTASTSRALSRRTRSEVSIARVVSPTTAAPINRASSRSAELSHTSPIAVLRRAEVVVVSSARTAACAASIS